MLRLKEFTVPVRPPRMRVWGLFQITLLLAALGVCAYMTGTWWSLLLVGYMLIVEGAFAAREWFWNRYADQCETTFREIGQSADSLAKALQAIAAKIESDAKVQEMVVTVDEPETVTVDTHVSTTHEVRYWVSESKGSN